jgi:hypothetical protein
MCFDITGISRAVFCKERYVASFFDWGAHHGRRIEFGNAADAVACENAVRGDEQEQRSALETVRPCDRYAASSRERTDEHIV